MTEITQPKADVRAGHGRARILAAALAVFSEQGYEPSSMTEIARRAEVVKSAIYHHFPSKAALYDGLLARHSEDLTARVAEALPQPVEDVRAATRQLVDAYLSFVEERPEAWRLMARDAPANPELADSYLRLKHARTEAFLRLFPPIAGGDAEERLYVELLGVALLAFAGWWTEQRDVPREAVVDAVMDFADAGAARLAD